MQAIAIGIVGKRVGAAGVFIAIRQPVAVGIRNQGIGAITQSEPIAIAGSGGPVVIPHALFTAQIPGHRGVVRVVAVIRLASRPLGEVKRLAGDPAPHALLGAVRGPDPEAVDIQQRVRTDSEPRPVPRYLVGESGQAAASRLGMSLGLRPCQRFQHHRVTDDFKTITQAVAVRVGLGGIGAVDRQLLK